MRNGQVFEFKSGTFGIEYPDNIAIFLGRSRKGKKHSIVAFTVRGKQYMRPRYVSKKKINWPDVKDELYDTFRLTESLRDIIRNLRGKKGGGGKGAEGGVSGRRFKILKISGKHVIPKHTSAREIWLASNSMKTASPGKLASNYLGSQSVSSGQLERIGAIVRSSMDDGLPYFRRARKNRTEFEMMSKEEYTAINDDIKALYRLRSELEGYKVGKGERLFPSVHPAEMSLEKCFMVFSDFDSGTDGRHSGIMSSICRWTEEFIRHDGWIGPVGLGGTKVLKMEEFDLDPFLRDMAGTVTNLKKCSHTTLFTAFLIALGLWTKERAMRVYMQRFVETGIFDFKLKYPKIAHRDAMFRRREVGILEVGEEGAAYRESENPSYDDESGSANEGAAYRELKNPSYDEESGSANEGAAYRESENPSYDEESGSANEGAGYHCRQNRRNLRDLFTVTVDPHDAKDFDDAISIVEQDGRADLYVHIADVSHYVEKDTPLDDEALYRATSVYLPDTVLPMLPEILSNDLCSLRAGEDRLAVTTHMVFDRERELVDFDIFPSLISVDSNLSYDMVLEDYDDGRQPFARWIEFSEELRRKRKELHLQTSEMKIHIRDNVVKTSVKRENPATRMIETFMVTTNEVIAMYMTAYTGSLAYRIHGLPDVADLGLYNAIAERMGLEVVTFDKDIIRREEERKESRSYEGSGMSIGDGILRTGTLKITVDNEVPNELREVLGLGAVNERNGDGNEEWDERGSEGRQRGMRKRGSRVRNEAEKYRLELRDILSERGGDIDHFHAGQDMIGQEQDMIGQERGMDRQEQGMNGQERGMKGRDKYYVYRLKQRIEKELSKRTDLTKRDFLLDRLNEILESVNGADMDEGLRELLNIQVLRTLQLALYSTENIGHFGLGSNCYLHFTSPIRRYADLMVHRILKDIFNLVDKDGRGGVDHTDEGFCTMEEAEGISYTIEEAEGISYTIEEADEICERCSDQARGAERFERSMNDICLLLDVIFDENKWSAKYRGIVSGIISAGVFVTLENKLDGFIPTRKLAKSGVHISDDGTQMVYDGRRKERDWKARKHSKARRKGRKGTKVKKERGGGQEWKGESKDAFLSIGDSVIVRAKRFLIERGQLDLKLISRLG